MSQIDWPKISQILFEGLVQGVVSATTVVIAYLLGKGQADREWKRELAQREKEHKELLEQQEKVFQAEERDRRHRDRPGPVTWKI